MSVEYRPKDYERIIGYVHSFLWNVINHPHSDVTWTTVDIIWRCNYLYIDFNSMMFHVISVTKIGAWFYCNFLNIIIGIVLTFSPSLFNKASDIIFVIFGVTQYSLLDMQYNNSILLFTSPLCHVYSISHCCVWGHEGWLSTQWWDATEVTINESCRMNHTMTDSVSP